MRSDIPSLQKLSTKLTNLADAQNLEEVKVTYSYYFTNSTKNQIHFKWNGSRPSARDYFLNEYKDDQALMDAVTADALAVKNSMDSSDDLTANIEVNLRTHKIVQQGEGNVLIVKI